MQRNAETCREIKRLLVINGLNPINSILGHELRGRSQYRLLQKAFRMISLKVHPYMVSAISKQHAEELFNIIFQCIHRVNVLAEHNAHLNDTDVDYSFILPDKELRHWKCTDQETLKRPYQNRRMVWIWMTGFKCLCGAETKTRTKHVIREI